MFLNRKKKGFGWFNAVDTNKKGEKVDNEDVRYLHFYFAKDCEPLPQDLNEYGSYKCDLLLCDSTGAERKVIPYIDEYYHEIAFTVLGKENEYHDPAPSWRPKTEPKWDWQSTLDGKPDADYYKNAQKFTTAEVPTEIDDNITEEDLPFL